MELHQLNAEPKELGDALRLGFEQSLRDVVASAEKPIERVVALEPFLFKTREFGESAQIARCLVEIGKALRDTSRDQESHEALKEAESRFAALNDTHARAETLVEIGGTYSHQSDFAQAMTVYESALSLLLPNGDVDLIRRIEIGVGLIYIRMDEYDNAAKVLESAISHARELGDVEKIATSLNNLAYVYLSNHQPELARNSAREALDLISGKSSKYEATMLQTYGEMLIQCGQYEEAVDVLRAANVRAVHMGDGNAEALSSIDLVSASLSLSRLETDFDERLTRAVAIAEQMKSARVRTRANKVFARYCAEVGDFKRAYEMQSLAREEEDETKAMELRRRLMLWSNRYERSKEEAKSIHDRFLRELTESVPGVLYRWQRTLSGYEEYTYVSPRAFDILGITAEQLQTQPKLLQVLPEDAARYQSKFDNKRSSGEDFSFRGRFNVPNRGEVWLRDDARSAMDSKGNLVVHGFFRDVTEEKRVEDALRATESRFREAIEAGFDGFVLFAPVIGARGELADARVSEINRQGREMVSMTDENPVGLGLKSRLSRAAWRVASRILRKVLKTGEPFTEEIQMSKSWFKPEWAEFQFFRVGEAVALTIRETTSRRQLLSALELSEERWQLSVAGSRDGVWDHDVATDHSYASAQWFEMLGLDPDVHNDPTAIFLPRMHPEDRPRFTQVYEQHINGETEIYQCEFRMRASNGRYRWINSRGKATRDADGRAVRVVGTHTDITARKRQERLLLAVAEANQSLIQSTDLGLALSSTTRSIAAALELSRVVVFSRNLAGTVDTVVSSYERNPRSTSKFATADVEALSNYGPELEAGRSVLCPGEGELRRTFLPIMAPRGYWGALLLEHRLDEPLAEGEMALMNSLAGNIGLAAEQNETRQVIVQTNLELQQAVARAEKLAYEAEAALRAKSEFVANMSHEIRTPMHGVLGLADVLLKDNLTPEQSALAREIVNSGEILKKVINDILDFSKVEAGKVTLDLEPFVAQEAAAHCVRLQRGQALAQKLELKLIVTGDANAAYNGDRIRFQQILTNLLGNAVKFTESGSITTELTCEPDGLRLSVTDTGIGIPPERLASIFDPFSQADNSITRKYGGTGLGLTITRDLVKLMDGDLKVESEIGKGSRFSVYLPLIKLERGAVAEPAQEERESVGSIAGLNVLVAEDNKTNELLLTRLLKSEGVQYTVTRNGQEALDHFLENTYDLVLMDVQMPVLDGLTATKRIREFEGDGPRTPIIALTAGASEKNLQHALAAGMDDLLSKPYTRDQFCALLRRWSGRTD